MRSLEFIKGKFIKILCDLIRCVTAMEQKREYLKKATSKEQKWNKYMLNDFLS